MNPCPRHRTELALLAAESLEPAAAAALHAHLKTCQACRDYWEALRDVCAPFQGLEAPDSPHDLAAFHRSWTAALPRRSVWRWPWEWIGASPSLPIAAAAAAVLVGWFLFRPPRQGPEFAAHPTAVPPHGVAVSPRAPAAEIPSLGYYRSLAGSSPAALDEALIGPTGRRYGQDGSHPIALWHPRPLPLE